MTALWLAAVSAFGASAPVVDRIAAVVNDEVVALSDVYDLGREFVVQRCPAVASDIPEPGPMEPDPVVEPPVPAEGTPVPAEGTPVPAGEAPVAPEPTLGGEPGQPVVPGTVPDPSEPGVTPTEPIPAPTAAEPDPATPAPAEPVTATEPAPTERVATSEPSVAAPVPEIERCSTEAELEVLDALIRRVLIRQELARLEVDVTAADVDQAIDRTVRQYQMADRQALKVQVEASGKRWDQYRDELQEFLRTQAFQGRVLAPRVTVTDDEINDLYQRTARKVTKPVVKVSGLGKAIPPGSTPEQDALIVAEAEILVEDLNAGKISFEDAVSRYDDGAAGMFTGQEFVPGSVVEPLSSAIFAAPVGVFQPPVRMENPSGPTVLFILRVDEKTEKSEVAPLEEVKDKIKDQVFQEKLADAEEEWYQRARREAAVDVKLKVE